MILDDTAKIEVSDFSCQPDRDGFIIGSADTGTFLAVPQEAVTILSWFRKGDTVGEVRRDYQAKYHENPDLADFLENMQSIGLVRFQTPVALGKEPDENAYKEVTGIRTPSQIRFHFQNIPVGLARTIFSKTALGIYGVMALTAISLLFSDPAIIPERKDLVFQTNISVFFILFLMFQLITVIIHEMGHLTAAKAKGVKARLGFGNRMWVIVAETDLTGIWSISKKERYLPLLGGPLMDVILLSLLTYLMAAVHYEVVAMPDQLAQFARAMFLFLCFRLLWQMYFFVRTDFYYVFTTFFDCKNLMLDTKDFIFNKIKRFLGVGRPVDQSAIGDREMRVIRYYSIIWTCGRILALTVLTLYLIPVLWQYFTQFINTFGQGVSSGFYPVLDTLIVLAISGAIYGVGFYMWGRSMLRNARYRKNAIQESQA